MKPVYLFAFDKLLGSAQVLSHQVRVVGRMNQNDDNDDTLRSGGGSGT